MLHHYSKEDKDLVYLSDLEIWVLEIFISFMPNGKIVGQVSANVLSKYIDTKISNQSPQNHCEASKWFSNFVNEGSLEEHMISTLY